MLSVEVCAYAYNPRVGETDPSILRDGKLSSTVVNKKGVVLTAEQSKRLVSSVTGKHPATEAYAACFDPHHAFVFYDAAWKPVAWVEVCFECGNAEAELSQRGQICDVPVLEQLARELKLPLVPR